jgi:anti-sigma B factor antagonist
MRRTQIPETKRGIAVTMTPQSLSYEVDETKDDTGWLTTTVHCHGRLVSENAGELRELVHPLILRGGHIILEFGDLEYLDSSGLGAIVGLKVTSINHGLSKLDLVNLTPRVKKLFTITNLMQLFSGETPGA